MQTDFRSIFEKEDISNLEKMSKEDIHLYCPDNKEGYNSFMDNFEEYFQKGKRQYSTIQFIEISRGIKKWCPSAEPIRKNTNSIPQRGYQFPCLDDARASFENNIGGSIAWP